MEKITADLPQALAQQLNCPEFDDEAGIVIDAVKFEDSLILEFSLRYYLDETPPKKWRLTVNNYEDHRIVRDWTQDIDLYTAHPRLLEYNDTQTELYFNGITEKYHNLYADIKQALQTLTEDLDEVRESVLPPNHVQALSRQVYGLFARGPETILSFYQLCLTQYGIQAYFVGKHLPNHGNNAYQIFCVGESFVIGCGFHFEQLS